MTLFQFVPLHYVTPTKERCIEWCQENGLLATSKTCPVCHEDMTLKKSTG